MATTPATTHDPAADRATGPYGGRPTTSTTWLWLLGILAVGLGLRAWNFSNPVQIEEFNTVAAVAERDGVPVTATATDADPLRPVSGLDEVGRRSVMPFGIRNPVPLYHGIVHTFLRALPVADWSVRLPSLVAGAGVILGIFLLTRRLFGPEVALVAAAFTALDPIQVSTSWLARPYAFANLAVVASFLMLVRLHDARETLCTALWAAGYGLAVAAVGYFSPLSLLVVPAQVAVMAYWLRPGDSRPGPSAGLRLLLGLGGLALAAAVMLPLYGYWGQIVAFAREHTDYLLALRRIRLTSLIWHNLAFLGGLALIGVAATVIRWQVEGGDAEPAAGEPGAAGAPPGTATPAPATPAAPPAPPAGDPLPDNEAGAWLARLWLFLPQMIAIVAAFLLAQSIFQTRYLSFTTLGAAVLLAYLATRERSREVRLGVAATLALGLLLLGFFSDWGTGAGLFSNERARDVVQGFRALDGGGEQERRKLWRDGDAILVRPGQPEADFLGRGIPAENREAVERALLAPLNTLYADSSRHPIIPLTLSQARGDKVQSGPGRLAPIDAYYDDALAARLKAHPRFWITGLVSGRNFVEPAYLACLVPWLADRTGMDFVVTRARGNRNDPGDPQRFVLVPAGLRPADGIEGLTFDVQATDFPTTVHGLRPRQPAGLFTLGAVGRTLLPDAHIGVPALLGSEYPTPHRAADPNEVPGEPAGGAKAATP